MNDVARPPYPEFDDGAVCTQTDMELFFPEKGVNASGARRLCARCPFLDPCYQYALHQNVAGVWGGTTYRQRRKLREQLGIQVTRGYEFHDRAPVDREAS